MMIWMMMDIFNNNKKKKEWNNNDHVERTTTMQCVEKKKLHWTFDRNTLRHFWVKILLRVHFVSISFHFLSISTDVQNHNGIINMIARQLWHLSFNWHLNENFVTLSKRFLSTCVWRTTQQLYRTVVPIQFAKIKKTFLKRRQV